MYFYYHSSLLTYIHNVPFISIYQQINEYIKSVESRISSLEASSGQQDKIDELNQLIVSIRCRRNYKYSQLCLSRIRIIVD